MTPTLDNLKDRSGFYGSEKTPCLVLTYATRHGTWYCVEGSQNVNLTHQEIGQGVNVETVEDVDYFTWPEPIETLEELENAVDF